MSAQVERIKRKLADIDWTGQLRKQGDRFSGDEANTLQALRVCPELAELVASGQNHCPR